MIILKEKELDNTDWVGVSGDYAFMGKVMEDLSTLESSIDCILENENVVNDKFLMLGSKIKLLVNFIKKEMDVKSTLKEYPDIFSNLDSLHKIRNFVAHGNSFVNSEVGNPIVIIKNNKNSSEGMILDEELVKEYQSLFETCENFVAQLQINLEYYDDEFEL